MAGPVSFSRWLALPPIQPKLAIDVKVAVLRVVADVLAHADHEGQPSALAPIHYREGVQFPRRGYGKQPARRRKLRFPLGGRVPEPVDAVADGLVGPILKMLSDGVIPLLIARRREQIE